jgi:hypothetical protein
MRYDVLARELVLRRPIAVSPLPAEDLWQNGAAPIAGQVVAATYGLLAYYTRRQHVPTKWRARVLGRPGSGCWLAPTAHAACMVPYNLGVDSPRDVCLLVDVSAVTDLWGPGTAPPASKYPGIWRGGGIEFYCPPQSSISFAAVQAVIDIEPCGDTSWIRPARRSR